MSRPNPGLPLLSVVWITMSACSFGDVAFRQDDRVDIISPRRRATVSLPVTIRWRSKELQSPGTHFVVFIDRAPMPAGKSLRYIARRDRACRNTRGCPNEEWFRNRYIYRTTKHHLTLHELPDTRPRERLDRKERHEVVIVLTDAMGHRIGESNFFVEFFLRRPASD